MLTPFFHSPFSFSKVEKENNRALLLQFILSEILTTSEENAKKSSWEKILSNDCFFYPYDTKQQTGSLNRLKEHLQLLSRAFPKCSSAVLVIQNSFEKQLNQLSLAKSKEKKLSRLLADLIILLKPLLLECKDNVSLAYFLLLHSTQLMLISSKMEIQALFSSFFPKGYEHLQTQLSRYFEKKGLNHYIPKIASLIEKLQKTHVAQ